MDDNMYPNDGQYFTMTTPEDQAQEENKAKAEVVNATPQLLRVIAHLEERIVFYNSFASIDESILTRPDVFMHVVAANKIVVANLEAEKEALELLISES